MAEVEYRWNGIWDGLLAVEEWIKKDVLVLRFGGSWTRVEAEVESG